MADAHKRSTALPDTRKLWFAPPGGWAAMTTETHEKAQRRVRPWIAALLTLLGWGVGFYYAPRDKLSIVLSVALPSA
jgi:hypothetical protein